MATASPGYRENPRRKNKEYYLAKEILLKVRKTIAKHMVDVLDENGCKGVMFGDVGLMDMAANRATDTNLMTLHPMTRHTRLLTACERSGLFVKKYALIAGKGSGRGQHWWRSLWLKR